MTYERAMEILDPEHRDHYNGIEEVNEACRMGMEAITSLVAFVERQNINMSEIKKITKNLIQIITENPTLPIIAMVDGDVVYDDYGWYLASVSDVVVVGEYACYNERYYDDRNEFKEDYYDRNDDALCAKFGYDPRNNDYAVKQGKITAKQYEGNKKCEMALDRYLDEVADKAFSRAIIIYISPPNDEDYKDFMGREQ